MKQVNIEKIIQRINYKPYVTDFNDNITYNLSVTLLGDIENIVYGKIQLARINEDNYENNIQKDIK